MYWGFFSYTIESCNEAIFLVCMDRSAVFILCMCEGTNYNATGCCLSKFLSASEISTSGQCFSGFNLLLARYHEC